MVSIFKGFFRQTRGATVIEYALIAGLIAVAIAVVVGQIGASLTALFAAVLAGF